MADQQESDFLLLDIFNQQEPNAFQSNTTNQQEASASCTQSRIYPKPRTYSEPQADQQEASATMDINEMFNNHKKVCNEIWSSYKKVCNVF